MIEKIKAEIERRREKCADIAADASNEEVAEYYRGKEVAYDETLSFIESLEKEPKDVFGDHLSELIPTPINIPPISEDAEIVEDSAHLGIHGESLEKEQPKKINVTGDDLSWIDELKHDLEHPEELDERVAEALKKKQPQGLDEAAKQIAYDVCKKLPTRWSGGDKDTVVYYAILSAIAGAKWMAEQGHALTWEDVYAIIYIHMSMLRESEWQAAEVEDRCKEILRRFENNKTKC